jgi:diguanylate cyclase (GGDEF)-like protein/PAS domain S-box-containing protein
MCWFGYRVSEYKAITPHFFNSASDSSSDATLVYTCSLSGIKVNDFELGYANQSGEALLNLFSAANKRLLSEQLSILPFPSLSYEKVIEVYRTGESFREVSKARMSQPNWQQAYLKVTKTDKGVAITFSDLTGLFNSQHADSLDGEAKYQRLVDGLNNHFVYSKNSNLEFEYVSQSIQHILGYSVEDFLANYEMYILLKPEGYDEIAQQWRAGKRPEPYELSFCTAEGDTKVIELSSTPLFNSEGKLTGVEGIGRDVTEEITLRERVNYQANFDQLTGLYNCYAFNKALQRLLATFKNGVDQAVLCFIDMDKFKLVNDACGHAAGDELLRQISKLLSADLSEKDVLARLGGDEFCLIYADASLQTVLDKLEKLQASVRNFRFVYDDKSFYVGTSIGVVEINDNNGSAEDLVSAADAACYQAKSDGRNRYHVFDKSDDYSSYHETEVNLIELLQNAIEQDLFVLYKQNIVPLSDANVGDHYEILLRLPNPSGEFISPASFIPLAERYGMMEKIDLWVFERTFDYLESHPSAVESLARCSINLSGASLGNTRLLKVICARLVESSVPPNKICFEVTENTAVANMASAVNFIEMIREVGATFALDNFGVGMSSFTYLKNMPVDYVKIDGSFIQSMSESESDCAMVKAIHDIASSMGKRTIAEFVSDATTIAKLTKLGISYAQGDAIAKPRPLIGS